MSIRVERPYTGIVVVTIDSPATVNAISQNMLVQLARTFAALACDGTVRAVVLTGAGRRAFTTGIDLNDAEKVFKMDENDRDKDVVHQMEQCPFPIVGAINGIAINAGFEMALACDILLASPHTTFVDSHTKLGILPSWGLSQKLPRIVGANVARLTSLACKPMSAEVAANHGLVNEIVAEATGSSARPSGGGTRGPSLANGRQIIASQPISGGEGGDEGGSRTWDGGRRDEVENRNGGEVDKVTSDTPRLMASALAVAQQVAALPREGVNGYKRCMRDGLALPLGEARAEERRRAFQQYRALPADYFSRMKAAAGLTPRAKL